MQHMKCEGCGHVYYSELNKCMRCNRPSALNSFTSEDISRYEEEEPEYVLKILRQKVGAWADWRAGQCDYPEGCSPQELALIDAATRFGLGG